MNGFGPFIANTLIFLKHRERPQHFLCARLLDESPAGMGINFAHQFYRGLSSPALPAALSSSFRTSYFGPRTLDALGDPLPA